MKLQFSLSVSAFFKAVFAWVLLGLFLPCTFLLANNPPTGTVTITGTAQIGQILTVANTLADADGLGTISYQWKRDGVPILYGGTLKDGVNGVDGLDGAMGVTLSADGANVYATGLDDDSVSWFERNASTGALTYGGMLKDGVGGVDGLNGARSMTLSADGKHAYVTGWAENAVSWFERNASTGALTYGGMLKDGVGGVDGLGYAFDVKISADGKHAYVTGAGDDAISWHERNATTGALTYGGMLKDGVGGVDGLNGAYGVTLSPDGKHAYVAGANDDAVSWFERNATTGALTYGGMLKDGVGGVDGLDYTFGVTVSADGKHAYVTGAYEDAVSWYERNATTGALTYGGMLKDGVGGVDGLDYAFDVTLAADGKHAYVVGAADDAISWYERNATTGALTYGGMLKDGVGGVDGLDGAVRVTHSADGKYAYVTGGDDDAASWFTRNPITGALSYGPASDANYTLTADDVGKVITVTASYTDGGITAESVTSAGTTSVSTPALNDSNFFTARDLWFSDQPAAFATYGHIKDWNVTGVTSMQSAFKDKTAFDDNISGWDVSNVIQMRSMFKGASSFNKPIGNWNISSVADAGYMFHNASSFNQPIGDWNVSSVTNMQDMFRGAIAFNQPIGNWDLSKVTKTQYMFQGASSFNQPIGNWNVSSVTWMWAMFMGAEAFNQDLSIWDTGAVVSMNGMFINAFAFNQDIADWNTSAVTDMHDVFRSATSFNQDLSDWNVSAVTDMGSMFNNTPALSDVNKGLIHGTFSKNPNWTTDWSAHVAAPPPNQTGDNNQTAPPVDQNSSAPPVDFNSTLFGPLLQTLDREELGAGSIRLWGMILADGGSPVTEVAFEVADNLVFRNSTLHPASILEGSPNFSATLELQADKHYYYRAVATNAAGSTKSAPKSLFTQAEQANWWSDSFPHAGGWRMSPWLGSFRPYESGWIYHIQLGWAYAHPDGTGGLWFWFRDHHWMWTKSGVFPYLWKHDLGSWHYLLGTRNGQPVFFEWKESASDNLP